ncbi:MAG: DUF883 family protein [Pseudomonadota bacterium]
MAHELSDSAHRLEANLKSVISETEHLIQAAGQEGSEKVAGARARLTQQLGEARQELARIREATVERTRAAAKATDTMAHQHPWAAMGIAAAVGALLGWLVARR